MSLIIIVTVELKMDADRLGGISNYWFVFCLPGKSEAPPDGSMSQTALTSFIEGFYADWFVGLIRL